MKKRIVIFGVKYYPSKGGVSRITEELIRGLKNKYDITIYAYKNPEAETYIKGVRVIQFPEIPLKSFGVFIYFLFCFVHLMIKGNYDLVHVKKIDSVFFVPFLKFKFKNILITSHESPYSRDKWGIIAKIYFKINEIIFLNSGVYLSAISKPLVDLYEQKNKVNVTFIPNGIPKIEQVKMPEALEILHKKNIRSPYIFFAARRIMSTKGCHTLLEALKKINYKHDIVIAGDFQQLPKYTEKLKDISQGLRVHFLDYIADKLVLLALAKMSKLFVFPSETEGLSIMLLEIASQNVPIICSDIPENKAVLNEKEILFFKNKDSKDLSAKIQWAFDHEIQMKALANAAQKKVFQVFSSEMMVNKYDEMYQTILF